MVHFDHPYCNNFYCILQYYCNAIYCNPPLPTHQRFIQKLQINAPTAVVFCFPKSDKCSSLMLQVSPLSAHNVPHNAPCMNLLQFMHECKPTRGIAFIPQSSPAAHTWTSSVAFIVAAEIVFVVAAGAAPVGATRRRGRQTSRTSCRRHGGNG